MIPKKIFSKSQIDTNTLERGERWDRAGLCLRF
jgi:hypothetical protein